MELLSLGRNVSFASPKLTLNGNTSATFYDVEGHVFHNGNQSSLRGTVWSTAGPMWLEVWNPVGNGTRLHGTLTAPPEVFGLPGAPPGQPPGGANAAIPSPSQKSPAVWAGFLSFGALLLMGLFVARKRRPVQIDDVEWALWSNRLRQATSFARRYSKTHPSDPDGPFLLASALMVRGKVRRLIGEVEPLALRLPADRRSGVAFILAAAARQDGDAVRAQRWAVEASREPLLCGHLTWAAGRGALGASSSGPGIKDESSAYS